MADTKPLCRCRVLYIGSAVPTATKDGLRGIQEPLRERYPLDNSTKTSGIDSWLSVWSNGLLLEYVQKNPDNEADTTFFPIDSLHYCAAVRLVNVSSYSPGGVGGEQFIPLDSPFANLPNSTHPPVFAAMLRKSTGVRILECHSFIATNAKAANALVRCCFHAYADSMFLKVTGVRERQQLALPAPPPPAINIIKPNEIGGGSTGSLSRSGSDLALENGYTNGGEDDSDVEVLRRQNEKIRGKAPGWQRRQQAGEFDSVSISSSSADRYATGKNGRNSSTRPPSEAGYAGALVPYEPQTGTWRSQRSGRAASEHDLFATYGSYGGYGHPVAMSSPPGRPGSTISTLVPYMPHRPQGFGMPSHGPPGSVIMGPPFPRGQPQPPMFDPRMGGPYPLGPGGPGRPGVQQMRGPPFGIVPHPGMMQNGAGSLRGGPPGEIPFSSNTLPNRSGMIPTQMGPPQHQQMVGVRPPMGGLSPGMPPQGPRSPPPGVALNGHLPARPGLFRPAMMMMPDGGPMPRGPHMANGFAPPGGQSMSPPPFVGRPWNGFNPASPYNSLPRGFEEPPMGGHIRDSASFASYAPANFHQEQYDAYYSDYLRSEPTGTAKKRNPKRSSSGHRFQDEMGLPGVRESGFHDGRSQFRPDREQYAGGVDARQFVNGNINGSTMLRGEVNRQQYNGNNTIGRKADKQSGKHGQPGRTRSRDRIAGLENNFHDMNITETGSRRGIRNF